MYIEKEERENKIKASPPPPKKEIKPTIKKTDISQQSHPLLNEKKIKIRWEYSCNYVLNKTFTFFHSKSTISTAYWSHKNGEMALLLLYCISYIEGLIWRDLSGKRDDGVN